jgi:Spt5 C-terminal nonapeptide repeat binding Spt4
VLQYCLFFWVRIQTVPLVFFVRSIQCFEFIFSGGRLSGASTRYDRTPMTGMTPSYGGGGRTPMYGSQTPLYDGSRTPHYGSATPSHDGSATPGRSGAWDPSNANTPSRLVLDSMLFLAIFIFVFRTFSKNFPTLQIFLLPRLNWF